MFLKQMYEVPSYGRDYFKGIAMDKDIIIGVGLEGLLFISVDDDDPEGTILGSYSFDVIESFIFKEEVTSC